MKSWINEMSKERYLHLLMGIMVVLLAMWGILYVVPSVFATLFYTLLGNIILLVGVIMVGMVHPYMALVAGVALIMLYKFSQGPFLPRRVKEGLENAKEARWSQETVDAFIKFQKISNPKLTINMDLVQSQATEEEAKTLIATGYWPWTKATKDMYIDEIVRNETIKIQPDEALAKAMKVYNENSAKMLLSWNTKEGKFLLNGTDLGESQYDPLFAVDKNHDFIKCIRGPNEPTSYMEKTTYLGTDSLSGFFKTRTDKIANKDLPNVIPGFGFIRGECNPCAPLNANPNYSCAFSLHTKDNNTVSPVWQSLWKL